MPSMLVCVSHSPIIMVRARAPADEPAILALYAQCVAAIERFEPEYVVIFGSDHFAGFFYANMPAYCLAFAAAAVGDVGGFAGALEVPADAARALLMHLRREGFDPSVSQPMKVDHAFSQPLKRLTGALDRYPVLPIFIGALTPPFLPFARSRSFGASVGRYFAADDKRVLYIGSGGLSHHPTRYYPLPGEATPEVAAWQMAGPQGGSLSEQQWLSKLYDEHLVGAQMLISGQRTERDICLNPAFDREFMARLVAGELEALAAMDADACFAQAGIGSLELHTWIAALAAQCAAGGALPSRQIYSPTLEYGIGYGMAWSPPP
jgi:2,3-dihydroxyphenylpropionate 1,2-dioxygenase